MRHEEPPDFHSRKHSPAVDQTCGYRFRQIASRATPQYPNQEMAHARRHARRAARNRAISRNGGRVENRGRWWENSGRIRSAFLSLFRHGRFGRLNCRVAYALLSLSIFLSFPRFFTTLVLPPLGKMISLSLRSFLPSSSPSPLILFSIVPVMLGFCKIPFAHFIISLRTDGLFNSFHFNPGTNMWACSACSSSTAQKAKRMFFVYNFMASINFHKFNI